MSASARLLIALVVSIASLLGVAIGLLSVFIVGRIAIPVGVVIAAAGPWVGVVLLAYGDYANRARLTSERFESPFGSRRQTSIHWK